MNWPRPSNLSLPCPSWRICIVPTGPNAAPGRRIAKEKGLAPLAEALYAQEKGGQELLVLAEAFVGEAVPTAEDALAGAQGILAEQISDDANVRRRLRVVMMANGRSLQGGGGRHRRLCCCIRIQGAAP